MRILLDTNILCRLAQKGHPQHLIADEALAKLLSDRNELCVVPQVLYEYWVVVTRPLSDNGLGMPPSIADEAIGVCLDRFTLLRDERGVFSIWRELARQYHLKGKSAHDGRLVAAMKRHNVEHLLTFNVADFQRYSNIDVLDAQLIAAKSSE